MTGDCCEAVDWWSFGCLTSEMLTGSTPFSVAGQDVSVALGKIISSS